MTDFTGQHPTGRDATTASAPSRQSHTPSRSTTLANLKIKIRSALRQYPDFPSPGILFEDILPIFQDATIFEALVTALELHILETYGESSKPDIVVGLEARGFLFGPTLALRLGAGFVPVRKKGKLPGPCETASYQKEYGEDFFQIQRDAIKRGQKVLVVDDLIATGGSAAAAGTLVGQLGGVLLGYVMIIELDFLRGRDKLSAPLYSLLSSQEDKPAGPP
ncbi:MAG: hypothetical protein Q9160_000484 [Pyrenula sp. 1 TL-2023]